LVRSCEILLTVATDASVIYEWRGAAEELELDWLRAEAFDHPPEPAQWQRQLENHSLGWVCARMDEELVGFVNVIWDGGSHAVLLDAMVLPSEQHLGIGSELVRRSVHEARRAGCDWMHVDFDRDLAAFFLESCGFGPTEGGLLDLRHGAVASYETASPEPADPEPASSEAQAYELAGYEEAGSEVSDAGEESAGAESGGAESGGAESGGEESAGAESGGAESGGE